MRLASVLSLSQIEAPSPEVLSMLAGLASSDGVGGELGSSALLVLGAMTRFDSSGVGMESLLGLKGLAEERGVRPWLLALGNAGTVAAGEAALEYIGDPNPGVRVAALLAAGSLGPEVAAQHGTLALQDEESSVRAAGAQLAYENASAEELAQFSDHLDNEGSVIVRGEAYRALAARSDDAGHSLLIERLALESDDDLRSLLEDLLQTA
jgi:HEAT repeat protein